VFACIVDWLFPSDESNSAKRLIPHVLRLAVMLVLFGYCAVRLRLRDLSQSSVIRCALLFAGMVLLHFVVRPDLNYFLTLTLAKHMYWFIGLVAFYLMTLRSEITERQTNVLISVLLFLTSMHSIGEWFVTQQLYRNSDAYLILWLIPLLLLQKRPGIISILLVLLGGFAIAFTMKRGASIALGLSMLVFLTAKMRLAPKEAKKYLGLMCVLALMVAAMYSYRRIDAVTRWTAPGGGLSRLTSGRTVFYNTIVLGWQQGSILNQAIGAGFYSVPDFLGESWYGSAIYAHSDWLEILYDYGALGVVVFACFHVSIVSLVVKAVRMRHACAPALAMGYAIFFLVSIYSGSTMFHQTIFFSWLVAHSQGVLMRNAGLNSRIRGNRL